jgi:hypothetical protein
VPCCGIAEGEVQLEPSAGLHTQMFESVLPLKARDSRLLNTARAGPGVLPADGMRVSGLHRVPSKEVSQRWASWWPRWAQ